MTDARDSCPNCGHLIPSPGTYCYRCRTRFATAPARCPVCISGRWTQTPRNMGKGAVSRRSFCPEHLEAIRAADRAARKRSKPRHGVTAPT